MHPYVAKSVCYLYISKYRPLFLYSSLFLGIHLYVSIILQTENNRLCKFKPQTVDCEQNHFAKILVSTVIRILSKKKGLSTRMYGGAHCIRHTDKGVRPILSLNSMICSASSSLISSGVAVMQIVPRCIV